MEKKSIAALIVTGAMVLGLSACGTNGATSGNSDNSQDTSTPAITEPVDASSQTQEVELPPVEVFYNKDYDFDGDWTISKEEWEQWCKDHPEDTNKNMTLKDEQEAAQQQQTQVPDTSGNPDPGSEETTKPSTSTPSTSKPSTSTPSTSKPSTSTPSTGGNTSSGNQTTTTPDNSTSESGQLTEQEEEQVNDWAEENGGYYDGSGGLILPGWS